MDVDAPNTKTVLILAAGELFAEHGFDGVSTRMIAEKAGVNLGCIHYHFGSKETLYVEAFRYVTMHEEKTDLGKVLSENPELGESRDGLARAVYLVCQSFLNDIFDTEKPEWRKRLIVRELSNPSSAMPILVRDIFQQSLDDDIAFYKRIKPDASESEAMIWQFILKSQAIFYLMSRTPIEMMRDGVPLDESFLHALVRTTAKTMILLAGLPMPKDLE